MDKELNFKGTHKEIGEQVGLLYKEWGKKELFIPPLVDGYYSKQLDIYGQFFPTYLEFLEGVSNGLGIDKDIVLKSYLTGFLSLANKPVNKCSAFAVKNDKGVFVGRNYDWLQSSEQTSKMLHFEFTDNSSNNFTGISDMGTWEMGVPVGKEKFVLICDEAWNSKGLYIALNGAPEKEKNIGISTPHVIQLVVEQCSSTEEAVDLISKLPIPESKIFTIADKNGNFAVIEKSIEAGTKVRKTNDLIIATNHFNHPDLLTKNIEIFENVPFHSTFARYAYLQYNLTKSAQELDLDSIQNLLGKPPTLQSLRGIKNGDVLTIWITALNLSDSSFLVQFTPLFEDKFWVKSK